MWQRQLRKIAVGVLDQASERIADSDELAGAKAAKLARKWNKLDREEKQHVAELVVGIATAVAGAVSAIASAQSKKKRRRVVKKLGKKAITELSAVAGEKIKGAKKKAKKAKKK